MGRNWGHNAMAGHAMSCLYSPILLVYFLCSMVQNRVNKTLLFIGTFSNHLPMFRCHSALPTGAISTTGATSTTSTPVSWAVSKWFPHGPQHRNEFTLHCEAKLHTPAAAMTWGFKWRWLEKVSDFFWELRSDRNAFRAWKVTTSGATLLPWVVAHESIEPVFTWCLSTTNTQKVISQ